MTALLLIGASTVFAAPIEPAPLTVGRIDLLSSDIFAPNEIAESGGLNAFLRRTMNRVHIDTRRHVLEGELLFAEGDDYNPALLAETERNLRALGFLTDVFVAAVDTGADGRVTVQVRTRETWTLETSVSYSLAGGGQQRWSVQLADDNFMGRGVTVGAGLGEDEDSTFWNLWYRQRRLLRTGLTLAVDYADRRDGAIKQVRVSRPFYAQDDAWGLEVAAWDNTWDNRIYLSNGGPFGVDPDMTSSLYTRVDYRERGGEVALQARLTRAGQGRIWRIGAGVRVFENRFDLGGGLYRLSDERIVDLSPLERDGEPFAREQGTTVFPYLWIRTLGRSWDKATYVLKYGAVEDIPLSWDVDLKLGPAGGRMGSTTADGAERLRWEAALSKWRRMLGGHALLLATGIAETGGRAVANYRYDVVAGWLHRSTASTPWLVRLFAEYAQGRNLTGARAFVLGLDRGLRTLDYDGGAGERLVRWNAELGRTTGWEPGGFFRLGVAAFYAGGGAGWRDEPRALTDLRHECGVGLRFGPLRSAGSQVARVDLAVDLDGGGPVLTAVTGGYF